MNLTFKGFLRAYCRELTGLETDNLRKLCAAAATSAPAAAEAVMLFAAVQEKQNYLASLSAETWMHEQYVSVAQQINNYSSTEKFLRSDKAPERYKKVWNAYQAKRTSIDADRRVIGLMREKTIEAMSSTNITAYSISKALKLNKGNLYAYLHKGDETKVSRATARSIMEFCEQKAS